MLVFPSLTMMLTVSETEISQEPVIVMIFKKRNPISSYHPWGLTIHQIVTGDISSSLVSLGAF